MDGMKNNVLRALVFLVLMLAGRAAAEQVLPPVENQGCIECHARPGITITFQNNEQLSATVDQQRFRASAHGALSCSICHIDFGAGRHPNRSFKSRDQYRIKSSLVCRRCHTDEQIRKHTIHEGLLREERHGNPPVCTNCHGSHTISRITGRKSISATSEEQYCMTCHGRRSVARFENGDTKPMRVDLPLLRNSVHGRLSCSDCHYGFSSEDHPQRKFRTARDFSLASSENCRRCHFDKYTKTLEGIHYVLLSQGHLNAPVCTDCHGSHEISRIDRERAASARRCQRCHAREYDVYARSVHGDALFNEHNEDVPVCVDCHTAHTIQDPFSMDYREQIPEMCSNCHARKEIVGKYGLSVDVVKSYLSDFHGITLGLYRKQKGENERPPRPIAVCIDCHGTHNITSTVGPEPATVKKNLLKRCQKCHQDANERFPDAWLSHYEPSLKRTPLIFLAGVAYKIFIPLMIIGLVLQILLHIWRYAINR